MPIRKKDTARALGLLEEFCSELKTPEEQQLKTAVHRVMSVFQSRLFDALLDIQEFYEATLLNSQKSCDQKLQETNSMASRWQQSLSAHNSTCSVDEQREPSSSEPSREPAESSRISP
ncbi:disks large homolog 1-like, partial [Salarias fasciatus]|uniref:disks large homolog 1-like n=1 Tax=Salarias fasciatus TaxID=181472 RepID=UPI00117703F0